MGLAMIVFALMLPAIAKLRLEAARSQSKNNLKQLALASHNYSSTQNHFPPGVDANGFSASAHLLPYIEQDNVFNLVNFKKSVDDDANKATRKLIIKTFINPLDPMPSVTADYGATNYLFNAGTKPDLADNNGVFYRDSKIQLEKIPDGTSNTVLAAETLKGDNGMRAMDVRRQHVKLKKAALKGLKLEAGVQDFKDDKNIAANRCASWMDGRFLQGTFTAGRTVNDPRPDVDCAGAGGWAGLRSMDKNVAVALCDGSVRTISVGLSFTTWQAACTRDGGEVLGSDW
jgi:hypothetical protein